jgi:hypothetical protein
MQARWGSDIAHSISTCCFTAGQVISVNSTSLNGWEGDNFLVDPLKPVPLEMPSREDPASLWFYSNPRHEHRDVAIEQKMSDCHDFAGYFHFVQKPDMIGVFNPGRCSLKKSKLLSLTINPTP